MIINLKYDTSPEPPQKVTEGSGTNRHTYVSDLFSLYLLRPKAPSTHRIRINMQIPISIMQIPMLICNYRYLFVLC